MVAVQGKDLTILRALASESAPVGEAWIARVAWKRKSHLDEKLKIVRRAIRRLERDGLVSFEERLDRVYVKGQGYVGKRSGFGWEITEAGRELVD